MSNPYRSTAPSAPPLRAPAKHGGLLLCLGLACSLVPLLAGLIAVPQFTGVFSAMGKELPWLTRAVVDWSSVLALLPLVVIAVQLLWPTRATRSAAACVTGVVLMATTIVMMIVAMYLPIFQLAKAI